MLSNQKKSVEHILEPLIKPLARVNPNLLTLLGSIPSLLFSFMISYTRSRSETLAKDKTVSFAIGIMERTERLLLTILALILFILFPNTIFLKLNIAEWVFIILGVLSFYTMLQRILYAYKKL